MTRIMSLTTIDLHYQKLIVWTTQTSPQTNLMIGSGKEQQLWKIGTCPKCVTRWTKKESNDFIFDKPSDRQKEGKELEAMTK